MSIKRIVVLGAGGCAREVAWLIQEINQVRPEYDFIGYIISDMNQLSERDSREWILGDYTWLLKNLDKIDALAIGIGMPGSRLKVAREVSGLFPELEWPVLVHPTARFDRTSCTICQGVQLFANVTGTVNLAIGDFSMISNACTLGHESSIGKGCVLNPSVNISGGVTLSDGVLAGTGSQVLQYLSVGMHATLGAGAVVTKSVPALETVVGIPARPLIKSVGTRDVTVEIQPLKTGDLYEPDSTFSSTYERL